MKGFKEGEKCLFRGFTDGEKAFSKIARKLREYAENIRLCI